MPTAAPLDRRGRPVRDLRLSVTDRCNFRCQYCMPRSMFGADHAFALRDELLTEGELARVVAAFAALGVTKVRLTGGEPLLRQDLEAIVARVAATRGIDDVALTTNGSLLAGRATGLQAAGLSRVTVSLDSIDPAVFATISDAKIELASVLAGIAAAQEAGLSPVKVNAVIQRGVNDAGVIELVDYSRQHDLTLRFIEYMDVGTTNGWRLADVVPTAETLARVNAAYPIEPVAPGHRGEVARRWRYVDGRGELGVVSSVTEPFCTDCTRARVTATGELFTCLFATAGRDLRGPLRDGISDAALRDLIDDVWVARDDRYSELRRLGSESAAKPEMSYLGG